MAEQPIYGVFDNALTLDETQDNNNNNLFNYGVYQIATQKPPEDVNLQAVYGTTAMPVFEWVKTIQTGQRTYDPSSEFDQEMMNKYKGIQQQGLPEGFLTPEQIEQQLIDDSVRALGTTAAVNVGMSLGDPMLSGEPLTTKITEGLKSSVGFGLPDTSVGDLTQKQLDLINQPEVKYIPELATKETAEFFKLGDVYDQASKSGQTVNLGGGKVAYRFGGGESQLQGLDTFGDYSTATAKGGSGATVAKTGAKGQVSSDKMIAGLDKETQTAYQEAGFGGADVPIERPDYGSRVYDRATSSQYITSSMVTAGVDFGIRLLQGEDAMDAATSAADTGIGTYIGGALGGPIGSIIGATVAPKIFGRVICNELCRQNLMTKEDVVLDLKFTQKYLTPQHVNGYHAWAVNVVRHLRKGKYIKLWKHIAQHRCNEIKYIMGKTDKPDYLGKIYRHVFETTCFIVGYFKKQTDWSVLYKGEKNGT